MWFFKKKKEMPKLDFSVLGTDLHSHFIPGIDDGAKDLETSILLIKKMKSLGYKKLITTPHVMSDVYQNTTESILNGLQIVKKELKNQDIDIEISAAAEYYVDFEFEQKISLNNFLTFGDNYILIELSFVEPPRNLFDTIFKLQIEKYKVVLAHPERYQYYNIDDYRELRNRGVLLQINLLSLIGYYSSDIKKKTEKMIREGLVNLVGTDCHNIHHSELYEQCQILPVWHDLINSKKLINHSL